MVLYMFLVGLDLDTGTLRERGGTALLIGHVSILERAGGFRLRWGYRRRRRGRLERLRPEQQRGLTWCHPQRSRLERHTCRRRRRELRRKAGYRRRPDDERGGGVERRVRRLPRPHLLPRRSGSAGHRRRGLRQRRTPGPRRRRSGQPGLLPQELGRRRVHTERLPRAFRTADGPEGRGHERGWKQRPGGDRGRGARRQAPDATGQRRVRIRCTRRKRTYGRRRGLASGSRGVRLRRQRDERRRSRSCGHAPGARLFGNGERRICFDDVHRDVARGSGRAFRRRLRSGRTPRPRRERAVDERGLRPDGERRGSLLPRLPSRSVGERGQPRGRLRRLRRRGPSGHRRRQHGRRQHFRLSRAGHVRIRFRDPNGLSRQAGVGHRGRFRQRREARRCGFGGREPGAGIPQGPRRRERSIPR